MCVAVADVDNLGTLNILTTTFIDDYFPMFQQDKSGFFDDASTAARLTMLTKRYLGRFADFDNDGKRVATWRILSPPRDLWLANGHRYPRAKHYFQPSW
jgi:hypothetical protein